MKRALTRTTPPSLHHHGANDQEVDGPNPDMTGDTSKIHGHCCGLRGDVSELRGDVSGILGDVSGIRGDVSGCELTLEERVAGVQVALLVAC